MAERLAGQGVWSYPGYLARSGPGPMFRERTLVARAALPAGPRTPRCSSRCPATTEQGISVRTYTPKPADITRVWCMVDADGPVLGRLATEVAGCSGASTSRFSPLLDTGDHVIVVNAAKVEMTAGKAERSFTTAMGYPGGLTSTRYSHLMKDRSDEAFRNAITRHAAEEPARAPDGHQAEGLRRRRAPPRRPAAHAPGPPGRTPHGVSQERLVSTVADQAPAPTDREVRNVATAAHLPDHRSSQAGGRPGADPTRARARSPSTATRSRSTSPRPPTG